MEELKNLHSAVLLGYFLTYFIVAFLGRSLMVWRMTGINPYVLSKDDTAHGYVGKAMRGLLLTILILVVGLTLRPDLTAKLGPLGAFSGTQLMGWTLLLASLLWIAAAQAAMGPSWRIGIDSASLTPLVVNGPFALSRNPIFLGMRLNLLGLFLVLPNAVTLTVLVAGELLMQIQVRLEEDFLSGTHGPAYTHYRQHVRRWL
jgi:protein-S-isoprenylcysteine O-methyltransferase Ste14